MADGTQAPLIPDGLAVSVVIPAYNAAATVGECVRSLRSQIWTPDRYEIIVVDDGSTDATAAAAAAAGATVITQPNQGAAAARNRGAARAAGDLLLFTDADCVPRPDWVQRMAEPFADPRVEGAKGVYETAQRALVARLVQLEYEEKYRRMAGEPQIDFIDTYAAAYRRSTFRRFGGFDTRFPGASVEDQELSFRMAEAGCRLVFAPQAVVRHTHAARLAAYARKKWRIGFWKVLVHQRHPGKLRRDSHTPTSLKLQIPLIYGALALTAAWLAGRAAGRWPALAWGAFALSGAGSVRAAARRDPAAAAAMLPFLAVRSLALGAGLAAGLADLVAARRRLGMPRRGGP